jgi:hypothetical protein
MKLTLRCLIFILLATGMTGCKPGNSSTCAVGQEIVIPSADTSDPSLVMDLHLPNGNIVTVTPGSTITTVPVPGGGRVTVVVNAKDPEGAQDAQIWAAEFTVRIDPNTGIGSQSGPGLLGAPTISNKDNGSAGQKGCTERIATTNLEIRKSATANTNFEVHAIGINFGGKRVMTPLVKLVAQ